jgi:sugar O-acyltransferase (sialic acid O-acetyltransferase NeuD family)
MPTLYILGTGGFAKEVAFVASEINAASRTWDEIAYLCETADGLSKVMPFGRVAGTDKLLATLSRPAHVAIGIGKPNVRRRLGSLIAANPSLTAPNLVHPLAGLDPTHVKLGCGNVVTRGAVFTCDISAGHFNVFNLNCTVGHDVRIGSFNVVNPGCNISGGCSIGDACLFGTGSQLLEGLTIADETTVGAGAVVVRSVTVAERTMVGVPARALDK